jgi:hypothetical protein
MVPSVAATAAIGIALAQGALAASIAVSGQEFKISFSHLEGTGFVQYTAEVKPADGATRPVAVSAFEHAEIDDLCQSVVIPLPIVGDITLRITAGGDSRNPVEADNLFIDLEQLDGDAIFTNIDIGVTADSTRRSEAEMPLDRDAESLFAQQADGVELFDVEQIAWATSAGSFTLTDLSLSLHRNGNECF